jgi:hypothetical protein
MEWTVTVPSTPENTVEITNIPVNGDKATVEPGGVLAIWNGGTLKHAWYAGQWKTVTQTA